MANIRILIKKTTSIVNLEIDETEKETSSQQPVISLSSESMSAQPESKESEESSSILQRDAHPTVVTSLFDGTEIYHESSEVAWEHEKSVKLDRDV